MFIRVFAPSDLVTYSWEDKNLIFKCGYACTALLNTIVVLVFD